MRVDEKKAIKAKRLQLLLQIDKLNPYRCNECVEEYGNIQCNCSAAVEIRKLGERLDELANTTRLERIDSLINQGKVHFTAKIYNLLKDEELLNREIAHKLGWSESKLQKWKKERGLADERLSALRTAQRQRREEVV